MNKEIEKVCKKHGFDFQLIENGMLITKPKDIWEGVEFVIPNHNSTASKLPYKVVSMKDGFVQVYCPYSGNGELTQLQKSEVKKSTESAYVEQLKKEAHERFGEIKEGDRFKQPLGDIWTVLVSFNEFVYFKERDVLMFGGLEMYEKGKWATKLKERVKVEFMEHRYVWNKKLSFDFKPKNVKMELGLGREIGQFLASKLEEYLNQD